MRACAIWFTHGTGLSTRLPRLKRENLPESKISTTTSASCKFNDLWLDYRFQRVSGFAFVSVILSNATYTSPYGVRGGSKKVVWREVVRVQENGKVSLMRRGITFRFAGRSSFVFAFPARVSAMQNDQSEPPTPVHHHELTSYKS